MANKLYYFAYGSNLLMEQMSNRCPSSLPHTRGILRDYKLVYKANPRGRGVADVIKSKGDKVYGAIYEVTPEDLKKLDRYEGRPTVYDRKTVKVETRFGMIDCIVYIMSPKFEYKLPSVEYFKKIFYGYGDWSLPQKFLTSSYKAFKKEVELLPPAKNNVAKKSTKNNGKKKAKSSPKTQVSSQTGKNGGTVYKTRTPFGYEPAIKWI